MSKNEVATADLEGKLKVASLIDQIAKREYPAVYVVEENSVEDRFVWGMQDWLSSDVQKRNAARDEGIVVLNGIDVVRYLSGEMDPDAEQMLRDEILAISAATHRMVEVNDNNPERPIVAAEREDSLLFCKIVFLEELCQQDVEQWCFLDYLEDLTNGSTVAFTVQPTQKVLEFIQNRDEAELSTVRTLWS
jgi:hypothetical protein